jgi:hypothetical protein
VERLDASRALAPHWRFGRKLFRPFRAAYSPQLYQKLRIWLFSFGGSAAAGFVSRMRLEVKAIPKKAVSETIKKTAFSDSLLHFLQTDSFTE